MVIKDTPHELKSMVIKDLVECLLVNVIFELVLVDSTFFVRFTD
jgi:hypothetical protein